MKIGDLAVCVNEGKNLTIGKTYTILDFNKDLDYYIVLDDSGNHRVYRPHLLKSKQQWRAEKIEDLL